MNPEVFAVGGLDDGLVEVGVLDDPVEPAVEDVFVGMGFAGFDRLTAGGLLGVRCLGNLDVGSFAKGVLRGIDSSVFDVKSIAAVARADDDRLACEGSKRFKNFLAKLLEGRNELRRAGVVDVVGNCDG